MHDQYVYGSILPPQKFSNTGALLIIVVYQVYDISMIKTLLIG